MAIWQWIIGGLIVLGILAYANPDFVQQMKSSSESISFGRPFTLNAEVTNEVCDSLMSQFEPSYEKGYNEKENIYWVSYKGTEAVKKVCLKVTDKPSLLEELNQHGADNYIICNECLGTPQGNITCDTKGFSEFIVDVSQDVEPPCKNLEITLKPTSKDKSIKIFINGATLISNGITVKSLENCKPSWSKEIFPDTEETITYCFPDIKINDVVYLDWQDINFKAYQEKILIKKV